MIDIHGKLQMLKDQLVLHKNGNQNTSQNQSLIKTPNNRSQIKKQNMSKFINSKSRNSTCSNKQSKTAERIQNRTIHKPFTTLMLKNMVSQKKQSTADRKSYKKQIPKYIQK